MATEFDDGYSTRDERPSKSSPRKRVGPRGFVGSFDSADANHELALSGNFGYLKDQESQEADVLALCDSIGSTAVEGTQTDC